MGTDSRFAATMIVTLVIWSPAGLGLFRGDISFTAAAVRFAIALALSSIGVAIVNRVIVMYGTQNAMRAIEEAERRGQLESNTTPRDTERDN
ncbi:MAG: hypothetical protein ACOYN3_01870 [Acidimicrobiia bacterium]